MRAGRTALCLQLAELRSVPYGAPQPGECPAPQLHHHEVIVHVVLVAQTVCACPLKAEPGIVAWLPEHDYRIVGCLSAGLQSPTDKARADALPLVLWQHSDGSQTDHADARSSIDYLHGREQHVAEHASGRAVYSHQRHGGRVGRVKRLYQVGFVFATGEGLEMHLTNGFGVSGAEGTDIHVHSCSFLRSVENAY